MNKLKKVISIFIALTMILAITLPVLAEDTDPSSSGQGSGSTEQATNTGKLTITDTINGETYSVYKILNATWGGDNKYYYTVNDDFRDYFLGSTTDANNYPGVQSIKAEISSGNKTEEAAVYDYIDRLRNSRENVRLFAVDLAKYIQKKNQGFNDDSLVIKPTARKAATSNELEFTGLAYGYYLMVPTSGTNDNISGSIMFSLNTVNDNCVMQNKTTYPTPEKTVRIVDDSDQRMGDSVFACVGDELEFTVSGTVKEIEGYGSYYFKITDTLQNMKYVEHSAKIQINNRDVLYFKESGSEYKLMTVINGTETEVSSDKASITYTESGNEGSLVVEIKDLKSYYTSGSKLTGKLIYRATVLPSATLAGTGNKNEVYFTYSNNPTDLTSTANSVKDYTRTYVVQLKVNKTDGSSPLKGSSWELYKEIDQTDSSDESVNWKKINLNSSLSNDPTFVFDGIGTGRYKLVETAAPDGYAKISRDIVFDISAGVDQTSESVNRLEFINLTHGNVSNHQTDAASGVLTMTVSNETKRALPMTGGAGLYIVAGVAIVALLGFGGTAMLKRKVNGGE